MRGSNLTGIAKTCARIVTQTEVWSSETDLAENNSDRESLCPPSEHSKRSHRHMTWIVRPRKSTGGPMRGNEQNNTHVSQFQEAHTA